MSERGQGWKESVDGVVSEFDEVTRHLRRRQRQALRVAWSVVAAAGLSMGGLVILNLAPVSYQTVPLSPSGPLTLLTPPLPALSPILASPGIGDTAPPTAATPPPAIVASAPVSVRIAPRPARRHPRLSPPAALPAPAVAAGPVTAIAPPAAPPPSADPPSAPGLVDGLISGVLNLVG
jgi:hypothetical protein